MKAYLIDLIRTDKDVIHARNLARHCFTEITGGQLEKHKYGLASVYANRG